MDDEATDLGAAGFGLMFYNARWYDPTIGRFAQADTIVPGGVQGWDRYAYVNNSPVNYVDPSGHLSCSNPNAAEGDCEDRDFWTAVQGNYGVTFEGTSWKEKNKWAVYEAIRKVGNVFASTFGAGMDAGEAFRQVFGTITFEWCKGCVSEGFGWAAGDHLIKFDGMYNDPETAIRLVVHELGHLFDRAVCRARSCANVWSKGSARVDLQNICGSPCLRRSYTGSGTSPFQGFAGDWEDWQFGNLDPNDYYGEPFADMFLGWVYGAWGVGDLGDTRSGHMATYMPHYLTTSFGSP